MNIPLASDVVPDQGTGYVFAAYLFFLLIILIYIAILGLKFVRINKELSELNDELEARPAPKAEAEPFTQTQAEDHGEKVEATNG